jgi:uncharacterized protein
LNKPNHPPAGVLGIGMDAFLPPGVAPSESPEFGRAASLFQRCRAVATDIRAALTDTVRTSTLVNMLRSLRGREDWRGAWYKWGVSALKYILRSACMPVRHGRFLAFVYGSPQMRGYQQRDPRLLERHMHRYVNTTWQRKQRLQNLIRHYQFVLLRLPKTLFNSIYAYGHASLGMLVAKDGTLLGLCMRPPIFMGCEGELCLQLNDVNGHPLYRIVFSIVGKQCPRIVIGCLQGPSGEDAREVVRALTRNLHGMRPKQLMLSLVYAFAEHYGIDQIVAISNAAHPLRHAGRPLHSDYDAFWEEQRGTAVDGGWYALPSAQTHKSVADVPSNHRSAFRRREALRLHAEQLLVNALGYSAYMVPEPLVRERQEAYKRLQNFCETSWAS